MIELLLKQYPNAAPLIFGVVISFLAGGVWVNYRYMRQSMVTKKDMTIHMLEFSAAFGESVAKHYVKQTDCASMRCNEPTNGHKKAKPFLNTEL